MARLTPARKPARNNVLIVGAGPVGLALAIELGHQGIACTIVERNDRVGYAPRAKSTNVRTRELLRRWGIADELRAASPLGIDYPSNIQFVTRLSGYRLSRLRQCASSARRAATRSTPSTASGFRSTRSRRC